MFRHLRCPHGVFGLCQYCYFSSIVILLLLCPLAIGQDAKGIRFPAISVPIPAAVSKLGAENLYVIEADVPILLLSSPGGLVGITEEAGPIRIRAKFVDSEKVETRLYKAKQVFIVEATGAGTVELLVIPQGAKTEAEVIRKTLEVSGGSPKSPIDPPKTKAAHLTFIGLTAAAAPVISDTDLRAYLKSLGIKVHIYPADDPFVKASGLQKAVDAVGVPCFVLQDADGRIVGQARITTVQAVKDAVK